MPTKPSIRRAAANDARAPAAGDVRGRLLTAARAEFFAHGFSGTDTNRIARAAGLGPASFYRHFADKTEAFRLVYEAWIQDCWDGLAGAVSGGGNSATIAKRMAEVIVAQYRKARGLRASVHALAQRDAQFRAMYLSEGRRQIEIARARHAARGLPAMPDEEHLAMFYFVERIADALAFDELPDMDCEAARLQAALVRVLEQYLAGRPIGAIDSSTAA